MSFAKLPSLLIVDDEPAIRLLLNQFLQKKFRITTLNDGHACLNYLQQNTDARVLILDLNMPDISGLEVIKQIRLNAAWQNLVILVLSSEESSKNRVACLRAGADDFVIKPFNPQELDARIDAILRRIPVWVSEWATH